MSCCQVLPPLSIPVVTTNVGTLADESGTSFVIGVASGVSAVIVGATPAVFNSSFSIIGSSPISGGSSQTVLSVVPAGQVLLNGQGSIHWTALVTVPTVAQVVFIPTSVGAKTVLLSSTTLVSGSSASFGPFGTVVHGPGTISVLLGAATTGGTATLVSNPADPPNVLTVMGTFATTPLTPSPFPCPIQQQCFGVKQSEKHKC